MLLRRSTGSVHTDAGHLLVGRGLSPLPLPFPFPLGEFERLPLLLVLARNVVEGLALGRGLLADVPCPDQPDDVRGKDAYLEKSTGFCDQHACLPAGGGKLEEEEGERGQLRRV